MEPERAKQGLFAVEEEKLENNTPSVRMQNQEFKSPYGTV